MASRRTLCVLSMWSVGVVFLLLAIVPDRTGANFITYVDDSGESVTDDYVIDPQHQRKKVNTKDYNEALDRLIASALNQTTPAGNGSVSSELASSSAEQSVACIGNRKPVQIHTLDKLTVRKCCPKGQSFHRLSITTCHPIDLYEHMSRFSLLARQLDYYGPGCHEYGRYLRYNTTIDKKCVGQRLIFNDRGTQMMLIQNGSLLVTRGDRVEFYDDFCVEESGNMVLAAHICESPTAETDLFSGWLGTVMIVLALIASGITVLAYIFDRTLPHRYGPLIGSHAGFLALAILVELLLDTIHQEQYRPIVEVLVEISYALFVLFSSILFFSSATGTTSINYRLLLVAVFFISSCSLIAMALTFYSESVLFMTVLASLTITLTISAANIYTSFGRNHLGFNSSENPFEMINEGSTAKRMDQRKELTIVSTFACATQIIVWIPYSMNKYTLLSVLAWNAIIIFVVFVGLRRRSIGLCNVGQRLKAQTAGTPYAEHQMPRDTQTVLPSGYADDDADELRVV
ncbi:AGAP011641-PA-like protein [Anopheles sinensis]|uniref:AGAP011641-PA-like protein n=1 Tax=Anopheles sinensis TaxID=74873 RepID=A0A084WQ36_ANOSI|nr:AGAP011641-PA-like protein [Anopheles sinensis]